MEGQLVDDAELYGTEVGGGDDELALNAVVDIPSVDGHVLVGGGAVVDGDAVGVGRGESDGIAPFAVALLRVSAVAAHFGGVCGLRREGVELKRGLGDVNVVIGVAVEAYLPGAARGVAPGERGHGAVAGGEGCTQARGGGTCHGGSDVEHGAVEALIAAAEGLDPDVIGGGGVEAVQFVDGVVGCLLGPRGVLGFLVLNLEVAGIALPGEGGGVGRRHAVDASEVLHAAAVGGIDARYINLEAVVLVAVVGDEDDGHRALAVYGVDSGQNIDAVVGEEDFATGAYAAIDGDIVVSALAVRAAAEHQHLCRVGGIEVEGGVLVGGVVAAEAAVVNDDDAAGVQRVAAVGGHGVETGGKRNGACPCAVFAPAVSAYPHTVGRAGCKGVERNHGVGDRHGNAAVESRRGGKHDDFVAAGRPNPADDHVLRVGDVNRQVKRGNAAGAHHLGGGDGLAADVVAAAGTGEDGGAVAVEDGEGGLRVGVFAVEDEADRVAAAHGDGLRAAGASAESGLTAQRGALVDLDVERLVVVVIPSIAVFVHHLDGHRTHSAAALGVHFGSYRHHQHRKEQNS